MYGVSPRAMDTLVFLSLRFPSPLSSLDTPFLVTVMARGTLNNSLFLS